MWLVWLVWNGLLGRVLENGVLNVCWDCVEFSGNWVLGLCCVCFIMYVWCCVVERRLLCCLKKLWVWLVCLLVWWCLLCCCILSCVNISVVMKVKGWFIIGWWNIICLIGGVSIECVVVVWFVFGVGVNVLFGGMVIVVCCWNYWGLIYIYWLDIWMLLCDVCYVMVFVCV